MAGQIDQAEEVARQFTDFAESAQPERAIGEVLLAQVLLARGDTAAEVAHTRSGDVGAHRLLWGPIGADVPDHRTGLSGGIAGRQGHWRAMSRHGTKSAMFAPVGESRGPGGWPPSETGSAITAARDAARTAERAGQLAVAVGLARGHPTRGSAGCRPLATIAGSCPAPSPIWRWHMPGRCRPGIPPLRAAAENLAAAGFHGAADDAARQADEAGVRP